MPPLRRIPAFPLSAAVAAALIVFPLVAEGWRARVRAFNPDELQHVHTAWSWARERVPYRDFFEHHGPVLAAVLALPLRRLPVERSAVSAGAFLLDVRWVFWGFCLLSLLTVALMARALGGPPGAEAAALLAGIPIFWENGVEIRPDSPAALLSAAAFLVHFRSMTKGDRRPLFLSGVLWGLGWTISPKITFPLMGVALYWSALFFRERAARAATLRDGLSQAAGFLLPVLVMAAGLAREGALAGYWNFVWRGNAFWNTRFSPMMVIGSIARDNTLLLAAGTVGVLAAPWLFPAKNGNRAPGLLAFLGFGLVLGLWINPVPYGQSFLFLFPFWALGAFGVFLILVKRAAERWGARAADGLLAALLVAGVFPGLLKRLQPFERNLPQLQLLAVVNDAVPPEGSVLDAWTGLGVFRPHALFYPHLHREIRRTLPADWTEQLRKDLVSGRLRPAALLGHREWAGLNPELDRWIDGHYAAVSGNVVWVRKPPTDEDARNPGPVGRGSTPERR